MSKPDPKVLKQLSEPQRVVAKVLTENWEEVREPCPDTNGEFCKINGQECCFSVCPKLKRNQKEGSE